MAHTRLIPNYDLYGDQASPPWSNSFNFEWIPQRSASYQWLIQPHRHDAFVQVLYLTRGQVHAQIEQVHADIEAPCLIVVPAGHVHGFRFSPDIDGPVVTATQKALESLAATLLPELLATLRQPQIIPLGEQPRYMDRLMPLFLALEQESRSHAPGQVAAGMSLLLALMVQVGRICGLGSGQSLKTAAGATRAAPRQARQVERFRALVDRDFRTQHTVQAYAQAMGMTAGQLSRLCREALGLSAMGVIHARIVHEAQRELVYTSLPIKVLAAELGFEDDAYFSRFFRKHALISPKEFRARALSDMRADLAPSSAQPNSPAVADKDRV
jgi:AraC family transcriptional activator of pobA